ncbi:MAG: phosphopyruvate hydratase, partial [Oscillospiraceae bacterium]
GAHSSNGLDVQEFMIMPVGAECFSQGLQWCCEVYHTLAKILKNQGLSTAVGDEGGFAPEITADYEALDLICSAITQSGYTLESDFCLALDAAASEWKSDKQGEYLLPKSKSKYSAEQLVNHWDNLSEKYPIRSIEDPLDEEDWQGWRYMTEKLGKRLQLVGDDLFVTNTRRLERGFSENAANAVLIKPNQIGTVSETIKAVVTAKNHGYNAVLSHRSGETENTAVADLSVALNVGQIKTGAPCRGERTAKYNRLLKIEKQIYTLSGDKYGKCFR